METYDKQLSQLVTDMRNASTKMEKKLLKRKYNTVLKNRETFLFNEKNFVPFDSSSKKNNNFITPSENTRRPPV